MKESFKTIDCRHFDRREPEGEIFQKKRQDNGKERFLVASLLEMTDLKVLIEMTGQNTHRNIGHKTLIELTDLGE